MKNEDKYLTEEVCLMQHRGCHGRDCMIVGITTT